MYYLNSVGIVSFDDVCTPYGRKFLSPEHGRYVSTAFLHLMFEQIPIRFQIHPFDFRQEFLSHIIIAFSFCIFSIIAYGILLFNKTQNSNKPWLWLFSYIITFLFLYNPFFNYFYHMNFVVFCEYIVSLLPFLISFSIVFYFFVTDKTVPTPIFILCLISSFFTGISIETLNAPFFVFLCGITLFVAMKYLKSERNIQQKKTFKTFISILLINALGCLLYYMRPIDHEYMTKIISFSDSIQFFIDLFSKLIVNYLPTYLILFAGILSIYFSKNNKQKYDKKITLAALIAVFAFISIYFTGFSILFFHYEITDLLTEMKYFTGYYAFLLFLCFIVWGYFLSNINSENNKKNFLIHVLLFATLLAANNSYWIKYIPDIIERKNVTAYERQKIYLFEKAVIGQTGKEVVEVPCIIDFDEEFISKLLLRCLFILHYPDFNYLRIIVINDNLNFDTLTNNDFKFSDNLKHEIQQYQNSYGFGFDKIKEENGKRYYKLRY